MPFRRAARVDDLWGGEMLGVTIDGQSIVLINIAGAIYAYEDRCAHLGMALSKGCLAGEVLTCFAHEWRYDARTGCGINPKKASLKAFPVRIEDDAIWVDV
jgi:toluene monooxygenase system ferredoxin subunit